MEKKVTVSSEDGRIYKGHTSWKLTKKEKLIFFSFLIIIGLLIIRSVIG